jgi:hypothetical protein
LRSFLEVTLETFKAAINKNKPVQWRGWLTDNKQLEDLYQVTAEKKQPNLA